MKRHKLFKNSIFNIIYTLLNILFPLITSMYVTRVIMPEGAGRVAFAQSIASYFVVLASLGIPIYGIREIAKVNDGQKNEKTNNLFSELFIINFIGTLIALISYFFVVTFLYNSKENYLLFLCCGLLIAFNFINVDWFYRGREEYGYIVLRSLIVKILSLLSVIVFVKTINDLWIYALISSLAVGGNNIFNIIHSRKFVAISFKNINIKKHVVPVLILAVSLFFERIYGKIDTTMLGFFAGNVSTGLYTYGHKTVELALSISTAITAVFLPRLSFSFERSRDDFNYTLSKGLGIVTLFAFPMCIGLAIIAPALITLLYGNAFLPSATVIRWLCPLILINSFGDLLCYQTIIAVGLEKKRLPAAILGTFLNIGLNIILIISFAENGAAISSVISELAVNAFLLFYLHKKIQIKYNFMDLFKTIISCLLMSLVVIILYVFIDDAILKITASIIFGAASYFAFAFLFGVSSLDALKSFFLRRFRSE